MTPFSCCLAHYGVVEEGADSAKTVQKSFMRKDDSQMMVLSLRQSKVQMLSKAEHGDLEIMARSTESSYMQGCSHGRDWDLSAVKIGEDPNQSMQMRGNRDRVLQRPDLTP